MSRRCSIVADIGGTLARFAIITENNASLKSIQIYKCADFVRIEAALRPYLYNFVTSQGLVLDSICLAVAGVVGNDSMRMVNSHWEFSQEQLRRDFQCPVYVLNDFSAQALCLSHLGNNDLKWLRPPVAENHRSEVKAVIGPGTGLGVAALLPNGEIIESEAGHCAFAPTTARQQNILKLLLRYYSRVSTERLVSGPGLANTYSAISMLAGDERKLLPAEVCQGAREGDALCKDTITEFNLMLGSVCGDIALAMGAVGGIYLSGGVLRHLGDLFDSNIFLQQFEAKGRFRNYCQLIPIAQITAEQPGLLGAAHFIHKKNLYRGETAFDECD